MAQTIPIQPQASKAFYRNAARAQRMRHDSSALVDILAGDPRVRVLSDFRATTGCLIIACPLAGPGESGHRCAVMGPMAVGAASIACIHPSCWHFATEDFLEHFGLAGSLFGDRVGNHRRPHFTPAGLGDALSAWATT
jgi:hypothetical protein